MKEDNNDNAIKNPFLRVDLLFDEKIKELKKEIEDEMRREKEEKNGYETSNIYSGIKPKPIPIIRLYARPAPLINGMYLG